MTILVNSLILWLASLSYDIYQNKDEVHNKKKSASFWYDMINQMMPGGVKPCLFTFV